MCGIIGYTGNENAVPYLLKGLGSLEYRGYDSCGISVFEKGKIKTLKCSGRIQTLSEKLCKNNLSSETGIGHTRWATHGKPNSRNAHPHESQSGLFSVVHNGIIENHASLKEKLVKDGFVFKSETDTEVIAQLLEQNYSGSALSSLSKTVSQLEGSFSLGIICREEEGKIFCVRKQSPLVAAKAESGSFVASDITALLPFSKDIFFFNDDELAVIEKGKISFFDLSGNKIKKTAETIDFSASHQEKEGHEFFMHKEIMQQPHVIKETINAYLKNGRISFENINLNKNELQKTSRIYLVACGSAYHVALSGKYLIEEMAKIPCEADIASEFRYRNPPLNTNTLVIIISQSGETADSLAALRLAKNQGAKTLSVVNVPLSTIAQESDSVIFTHAGPEIAVATTKAYSCQLAVIYLLAAYISSCLFLLSEEEEKDYVSKLSSLDEKIKQALETEPLAKKLSEILSKSKNIFFIGRNTDYPVAMEGSLKLKEISYLQSEAYGAGELKHGTISLIEKGSVVIALCCRKSVFKKMLSNIREVKARGAFVVALVSENQKELAEGADFIISLPETENRFSPSIEIIPLQLLGYHTAKIKGCDIDKPRNLAKSVTVE